MAQGHRNIIVAQRGVRPLPHLPTTSPNSAPTPAPDTNMLYAYLHFFGGLSALGAAMFGLGIPKDSVIRYEEALKADEFLLVAHGPVEEMARTKTILDTMSPVRLDLHQDVKGMTGAPWDRPAHQSVA